jgi:hypothetical protein
MSEGGTLPVLADLAEDLCALIPLQLPMATKVSISGRYLRIIKCKLKVSFHFIIQNVCLNLSGMYHIDKTLFDGVFILLFMTNLRVYV